MRAFLIISSLALSPHLVEACNIVNERRVRIGLDQGIRGQCANNGQEIFCSTNIDEGGIFCQGPGGSVNGNNIRMLVWSACGCTWEEEEQQRLEEQLEMYP